MGTISPSQVNTGDAIVKDLWNNPINTITNEFNGNIDNANIKVGAAIATSKLAADAGITAAMISPGAITIGYAEITSSYTANSNNSYVDVPGLSVSVTVPAGGRRVKVTACCNSVNTAAGAPPQLSWSIREGSTTLQENIFQSLANNNSACPPVVWASSAPTAGSHTYKISFKTNQNANTVIAAAATSPAFILVELI